jgi:hypothetical protein
MIKPMNSPAMLHMNRRAFVAANWRLPQILVGLAKVPLQTSGSWAQRRRNT